MHTQIHGQKLFPSLKVYSLSVKINVNQWPSVPLDRVDRKLASCPMGTTLTDGMKKGMRMKEGDKEMDGRLISHFSLTFRVVGVPGMGIGCPGQGESFERRTLHTIIMFCEYNGPFVCVCVSEKWAVKVRDQLQHKIKTSPEAFTGQSLPSRQRGNALICVCLYVWCMHVV